MRPNSTQPLVALIVVAVAAPLELGGGQLNASVVIAGLLFVGWLLYELHPGREQTIDGSPVVSAALAFIAVSVLAFLVGQYPWFPREHAPLIAQGGGLAVFVLSAGLFLSVGHRITSVADLQRLTWLFVGVGAFQVIAMTFPSDLKFSSLAVTNVKTVGSLFWVWLVATTFSQGLFNTDASPARRTGALLVGVAALAWALLLAFDWASGWLPPLVGLIAILLLRFPRLTICGGLLLLTPAMILGGQAWNSIMTTESWSWSTRLGAWAVMLQLIGHNPLLGFGPANYPNYTNLFSYLGYNFRFNSHNNYLDLLAQTGIIGTAVFVWFSLEVSFLAIRLFRRVPAGFQRAYVAGVLGGLTGSLASGMLADWIIPFAYNIGLPGFRSSLLFWFFLGGLLALKRISSIAPTPERVRQHEGSLRGAQALY